MIYVYLDIRKCISDCNREHWYMNIVHFKLTFSFLQMMSNTSVPLKQNVFIEEWYSTKHDRQSHLNKDCPVNVTTVSVQCMMNFKIHNYLKNKNKSVQNQLK